MSTLLYRLGKLAYRARGRFLIGWVVVLVAVGGLLALNPPQTSTEFSIPGTASQEVMDKLQASMPSSSGTSVSIVLVAPSGERVDTPDRVAAIADATTGVYDNRYVVDPAGASSGDTGSEDTSGSGETGSDGAASDLAAAMAPAGDITVGPLMDGDTPVSGVQVASNGSMAMFSFQLSDNPFALPGGTTDAIVEQFDEVTGTGLTVLPSSSLSQEIESPMGPREAVGLLIAAIVLFVTLGTLRVAGMPLLTAIVGVGVGVGTAYALSGVIAMTSMTPILALMIGLAVGMDYALFIVNRARRLIMDKGLTAAEAVPRAVATAGSAVFFAGLTVMVALAGLSIIGVDFLTTMALVAAGTVLIAVLIALTLLPALLGFVGEHVVSPQQRAKHEARAARVEASSDHRAHGLAVRWATWVSRRRWWVTGGAVVVLLALAVPFTRMDLNLPSDGTANLSTTARQSYDAVTHGFGEGFNGPLVVVAESDQPFTGDSLTAVKTTLVDVDHVTGVIPSGLSQDGRTAVFSVIPDAGPTAQTTVDLVHELRSPDLSSAAGATLGVTGAAAINIDMSGILGDALVPYIIVIVVISLIILLLVFRSIFVPLTATLGFVLTIGGALGMTTAVFQWGWLHQVLGFDTPGPILSFLPMIITGILYGLAMDYQMFVVSSMRESHVHGHPGVAGVIDGFRSASRVVVAAAIIMVSVFGGFIFADDAMIKQIGFALAFGILIDAFVVRMTLIPAVMAIAGEKAWWLPRWLDRVVPNLDVEGDKLVRTLEAQERAAAREAEPVSV